MGDGSLSGGERGGIDRWRGGGDLCFLFDLSYSEVKADEVEGLLREVKARDTVIVQVHANMTGRSLGEGRQLSL